MWSHCLEPCSSGCVQRLRRCAAASRPPCLGCRRPFSEELVLFYPHPCSLSKQYPKQTNKKQPKNPKQTTKKKPQQEQVNRKPWKTFFQEHFWINASLLPICCSLSPYFSQGGENPILARFFSWMHSVVDCPTVLHLQNGGHEKQSEWAQKHRRYCSLCL